MGDLQNVLIWHWGRRGGGPRYTYELAYALKTSGQYNIHLSLSKQCEIFGEFLKLDLPSFHIDTYSGIGSAVVSTSRLPFLRASFWRYIRDQKIDIIICTMSHLWDVPMLFSNNSTVPFLLVLHDALPHPGDDIPLRHWWLKKEIDHADGIITLTQHVRNILCQAHNYPEDFSWVIPHGVFQYAKDGKQHVQARPKTKLLFFGRILPYKGLDLLLEAYEILRKSRSDVDLLISGPGDITPYQSKLDKLSGVTVDNRWIEEDEIGDIFLSSDICVLPYKEASQSGVIATAYAAGLPVVTTPIGGLTEQVQHKQTGLICEFASSQAIAESIKQFLDNPDLMERCATGAQREAQESLSWSAIASHFDQVIGRILQIKKTRIAS